LGVTRTENYEQSGKYTFEDLFDLQEIQELQDSVSSALGIGMVITRPDGTPITRESHFCKFCSEVVRKSEKGRENCFHSDSVLGRPNKSGPIIAQCLSAGLYDAGASIMVGNMHIASWLMGQVLPEDQVKTDEENRIRALELGIDPDEYCQEIKKVPRMTKEQFEKIANLVFMLSNQLSEKGMKNHLLKEELEFRNELERQLLHNSMHDPLTNLYNRMYFETKCTELELGNRFPLTVIVGDVNFLKFTNDIFGHSQGDKLLQTISRILLQEAKTEYIICRCGGDEFTILMPGAEIEEANEYCNRIQGQCSKIAESVLPPSIAMGAATRHKDSENLAVVIKQAEERMYLEKHRIRSGNNSLNVIRKALYETSYISRDDCELALELAHKFASYLSMDAFFIKNLEQLLSIQYMGLVAVPQDELKHASCNMDKTWESKYNVTEIEYRLAKMYDHSFPIARSISERHERWDGQGTPNQLRGEQIDPLTRIASIISRYVTLSGKRPHGFEQGKDETLATMKEEAGIIFDPKLFLQFVNFLAKHQ